MENKYLLRVSDLSHEFTSETGDNFSVLSHISFELQKNEFISVIGPSGCGKSTLIKIIAGLIKPKTGFIDIKAPKTSMVFQHFAIFPWLNVFDNVDYGLKMANQLKAERIKTVKHILKEVGLFDVQDKYPRELSGGMMQRVGIARALVVNPELLLMDEPFSSLDNFTSEKLRQEVLYFWQKYNLSFLMVTHLIEEAVEVSDKVIILSSRPAGIKRIMDIPLKRPRNKRSQEFFKISDEIASLIDRK